MLTGVATALGWRSLAQMGAANWARLEQEPRIDAAFERVS